MTRKVDSQAVWMDGRIVPADQAAISFFGHAVHYGTAVFEGIRCYETADGPAVFRLPEHLERLRRSATAYRMEYRWSDEELTDAVLDLIRRHRLRACYVRPVVMLGEGPMGVMPRGNEVNTIIAVWSWGAYLGPDALSRGVRVAVVKNTRKFPAVCLDPSVKAVGHYLNSVRATQEAHARGFDEGLILNLEGRIAEGAGENVFLVRDGGIMTNPPSEAILHGITRDTIIELARRAGVPVTIEPMGLEDLFTADEAFFTGTAAEVTPIREVDGVKIGGGARGPLTARLQEDYLAATAGRLDGFERWLTVVS